MSYRYSVGEDGQPAKEGRDRGRGAVGREEGGQAGGAMEREEGGRPHSGTVEMLAVGPLAVVENAEATRRSVVAAKRVRSSSGVFPGEWRQQTMVRDSWRRGYDYWVIGLVLLPVNGSVRRTGRPHRSISLIICSANFVLSLSLFTLGQPLTMLLSPVHQVAS